MPSTITVQFPAPCMVCEERVEAGERAGWESEVGIWHVDCGEPKNLSHYIKARDDARKRFQGKR